MIELGNYNTLRIERSTSVGLFLEDDEGNEVLLPNKYVPESYEINDDIRIFCYLDHEERPVATTLTPKIKRNDFGFLKVAEVNNYGAFLDWGLEKQLLVPFKEQRLTMQEGQYYLVYCYLDEISFRLLASNKLDKFLSNQNITVRIHEEVDLWVSRKTDLGWEVIINKKHKGLIFFDTIFKPIAVGDTVKGYIKNIRPDNKIDVSLQPIGQLVLEPTAQKIYDELVSSNGFLGFNDKSDPEEIRQIFQMSKKTFKKGIGTLYRERKIKITEKGIELI
ncbi:CvfB family protein [Costertonia aggregata]|uniref:GntR family transcriptional regulator n=1 Tax=Costertonia aggregata TaxID=343403 RepID=A0A7H9AUJ7_9FLAO|nr:S1-like domain-containing RNA-binding protein [Costertonia aggregata]QLG47161.1 GntR family transcriptional regulator [Costertonia aggregata]